MAMPSPLVSRPFAPAARNFLPIRWRRLTVIVAASLLLHLAALHWVGEFTLPSRRHAEPAVVAALLPPPPTQALPTARPPKPLPRPLPKPLPKPRSVKQPAPLAAAKPAVAPTPLPATPPATPNDTAPVMESAAAPPFVADAASLSSAEATLEKFLTESDATPGAGSPGAPAPVQYRTSPPPSAELKYDVQALRDGQTVYGNGKIGWNLNGNRYVIHGEAGILFFTVLSFGSEGAIDDFGVAPVRYSEKRFRKPETATHFSRDARRQISFSASTAAYPLQGGEQDRASIVWQLAAIGRGDGSQFAPGRQLPLFVAGVRDGEVWPIQVVGEEQIDTGVGPLHAWHLVRAPRPGSYDQKLDIWLAPQREWYPVRLRYTDANGDYLDLVASSIHPASEQ
jgi:hypothetical protein